MRSSKREQVVKLRLDAAERVRAWAAEVRPEDLLFATERGPVTADSVRKAVARWAARGKR